MFPHSRSAHLIIQELPTETLVFDQRTSKAHCLNHTTALVWRHCDGRADLAGLSRLVERELGIADGAAVVQLALEQLASRHLLEGTIERGSPTQRRSRRELLKHLAATAVALPVIMTVTAPRATAAGSQVSCSGKPDGTSCGSGQMCCSGTCSSGKQICASGPPGCQPSTCLCNGVCSNGAASCCSGINGLDDQCLNFSVCIMSAG